MNVVYEVVDELRLVLSWKFVRVLHALEGDSAENVSRDNVYKVEIGFNIS
jgi:hypothetical protein